MIETWKNDFMEFVNSLNLSRDDYKTMMEYIEKIPAVQPDHNADIGKKVEGDCISRQQAIDALAKQMPRSYTPDGSHPADEEIFRAQEIFADCIEALEILPPAAPSTAHTTETTAETTAPSTDDWTPCSERVPEEGQKCLVYDKAVGFRVDTYIGHGNPFNWELFVRDYEAWMPLPEPYRGGDT